MTGLDSCTHEELLTTLQSRFPQGVLAIHLPESEERLYLWWGDRTVALGQTSRLNYAINMELEGYETEVVEVSDPAPPPDASEGNIGQYL